MPKATERVSDGVGDGNPRLNPTQVQQVQQMIERALAEFERKLVRQMIQTRRP
jgi:hypothetical protein